MIDKYSLPVGWVLTKVGKICLEPQYGWTTSATSKGTLRLLRTTDITPGCINWDSVPFCKKEPPEKEKYLLKDGDIVISRAGSVGHSNLIKNPRKAVFGSYLIRFRPLIDEHYLAYFMKSSSYWKSISEKSLGIAIPNVNASKLKQITIPIPPLPEQHRIVAKIEELFTKLDAGVEALKKVKVQLKRYRQAVLKHAFEGKLTEEWREAHKGEIELASVLLERIKEERKKKAKRKYKELSPLDTSDLPELPEGWAWARLNVICDKIQDGSHFSPKIQYKTPENDRYLYITAKNIKEHGIDLSDVTYVNHSFHKSIYKRCNPEIGDVLLIKDGVKTGAATINNLEEEFSLLSSVALFKCNKNVLNSHYLKYFLNSPIGLKMITGKMTGTAIRRIILDKIRVSYIPLPPLVEQNKIVSEIECRTSTIDEGEKIIEQSLKRAEMLRQSILKRAFEGKLVPQDPSDEPAEKLLERIKAEKAKHEAERKKKGTIRSKKRQMKGR